MTQDAPAISRRLPRLLGAAAVVLAFGMLLVVACGGGGGSGDGEVDGEPTVEGGSGGLADDTPQPTVEATIALDRPAGQAEHLTSVGPNDRLVIPKLGVNATLSYKKVGPDGAMPDPNGPDDVAYYDFSNFPGLGGAPGKGGNAVFSGHVDYGRGPCKNGTVPPPCTAVFWDLKDLRMGDEIEVHVGGTVHRYRVTGNQPVNAATADWNKLVGSTAQESITMITCGGDFDRNTREYNNRQVVTAVRI
jgi:LPXTG-site transpeptidase (sortase) family protein